MFLHCKDPPGLPDLKPNMTFPNYTFPQIKGTKMWKLSYYLEAKASVANLSIEGHWQHTLGALGLWTGGTRAALAQWLILTRLLQAFGGGTFSLAHHPCFLRKQTCQSHWRPCCQLAWIFNSLLMECFMDFFFQFSVVICFCFFSVWKLMASKIHCGLNPFLMDHISIAF